MDPKQYLTMFKGCLKFAKNVLHSPETYYKTLYFCDSSNFTEFLVISLKI